MVSLLLGGQPDPGHEGERLGEIGKRQFGAKRPVGLVPCHAANVATAPVVCTEIGPSVSHSVPIRRNSALTVGGDREPDVHQFAIWLTGSRVEDSVGPPGKSRAGSAFRRHHTWAK